MKFLQQVAQYYITAAKEGKVQLQHYTFVFPNKRSAMFMRKYLREGMQNTAFMPKLITITAFSQRFCNCPIPSNSELIYILYDAYRRVMKDNASALDFDKFIFWGNIILADFNDIDAYLADPKAIFDNLENLNSISAQYLTAEQKEVAEALGIHTDAVNQGHEFWRQFDSAQSTLADTESKHRFLRLWQILGLLYEEFHKQLQAKGLAYSGLQSRMAYQAVRELTAQDFGKSRFAFIGFYVLPTSRYKIFQRLRSLGVADFFWDNAAPLLSYKGNKAASIINPLSREFPAPSGFFLEKIDTIPNFEICPVTSNVGQAKQAALLLQEWEDNRENSLPGINTVNTAVIMPNDRLLLPFIYAMPQSVTKFNVAMRVPFTSTPFATLLQSIMTLQEHARTVNGEPHYYYKDVLAVLSQPHIAVMAGNEPGEVRKKINSLHLYNVPAAELCEWAPTLHFIFTDFDKSNLQQAQLYLLQMLDGLAMWLTQLAMHKGQSKADASYELQIIRAYREAIDEIATLSQTYSVTMKHTTFFAILRRALLYKEIPFNGDPVSGLQILGTQDARVLDFDNLVFLSLNERIFPPKGKTHSLIPQTLRIGYALPTIEDEQITFAYQFYRITARSSRIALFYDSRPIDTSKGETSRFVTQLLKLLPPSKVKVKAFETTLALGSDRCLEVKKTDDIMAKLDAFKTPGEDGRNLSASALKDYLKCPMMFYLKDVCKMSTYNEELEYIDAASYGTIIHAVAQEYYDILQHSLQGEPITPEVLSRQISNPKAFTSRLTQMALKIMDQKYYQDKYKGNLSGLPGEGRVLAKIIANYMLQMIRQEIREGKSFLHIAGEYKGGQKQFMWKLHQHAINFTMSIDRIDELLEPDGNVLRFIDYKTGRDEISAASWEQIMGDPDRSAIFQLLTYALAYRQLIDPDAKISPYIYKFSDFGKSQKAIRPVSLARHQICDCDQIDTITGQPILQIFEEKFNQLINEIFSSEVSFTQTSDQQHCQYCYFASMCGRVAES